MEKRKWANSNTDLTQMPDWAADSEAAKTYVNIIAVKEGNENLPGIKALVDILKSDEIKNYINETFDGAVIPFE